MTKSNINSLTKLIVLMAWFSFLVGCANIVPPTGGPKDELPPKLLDSLSYPNSKNNTNRSGQNIILIFDEKTEVVGLKSQISSNPEIETKPIRFKTKSIKYKNIRGKSSKGTQVSINLNQDLDTNTTYVINFGNAFKDINEGKIASNISMAFSTGPNIDSMAVSGSVIDNYTTKPQSEIFVGLYEINDTISPTKTKPKYFTSTDENGNYKLQYIKNGEYNIYAFRDVNRNKIYEPNTESIAFINKTVKLDSAINSGLNLTLFKENTIDPKIIGTMSYENFMDINFNKGVKSITIDNYPKKYSYLFSTNKKARIYSHLLKSDSIKVHLVDSIGNSCDSTISLSFDSLNIYEQNDIYNIDYQYINSNISTNISSIHPIFEINQDSGSIYAKETALKLDSISTLEWNESMTNLKIETKLQFLTDTSKITLGEMINMNMDTINISKEIYRTETGQLGSLFFKVNTTEEHYIIYVIDKDNKILTTLDSPKEFELNNFKPQELRVKILIDKNNNGYFDNGVFYTKTQPEEYINISETFTVKAGWEITDLLININPKR